MCCVVCHCGVRVCHCGVRVCHCGVRVCHCGVPAGDEEGGAERATGGRLSLSSDPGDMMEQGEEVGTTAWGRVENGG